MADYGPVELTREYWRRIARRNGMNIQCSAQTCLKEVQGKGRALLVGDIIVSKTARGGVRHFHVECYDALYFEAS